MGVHPWTSYMIEVVALQQTLKEAHHEMQVAREFTHERTKQRIAHLNAIAAVPAVKAQPVMPQRLLGSRPGTPEHKQFDSACEDAEEDEGDTTSALDVELDAIMGKEMDATGHPARTPSAERHQQRNHTLRRSVTEHIRNSVGQRVDG